MEAGEVEQPQDAAGRDTGGKAGVRGQPGHPGPGRTAEGGRKAQAHETFAGNGGGPGVCCGTVVERARVAGHLDGQKREEDEQAQDRADLLPLSLLHLRT